MLFVYKCVILMSDTFLKFLTHLEERKFALRLLLFPMMAFTTEDHRGDSSQVD
jgi:hypothetical protein